MIETIKKRQSPFQEALLAYQPEVREWMEERRKMESMVFYMHQNGRTFPDNFDREKVLKLRGVHYEPRCGIKVTTLKEAMYDQQSDVKPPLYLSNTLIIVGQAGAGKSELIKALCRECCQRRGKENMH